ncbi:MAG: PAS domain S-box protein [Proteobacteria bacterium]|nr:PAS domain S-box protein [Pseudomonadota bacterium]
MSKTIQTAWLTDPAVRIGAALILAIVSVFFFAFIYAKTFESYSRLYFDLPLLVMVIASLQYQVRRIKDRYERRFWNLVSLGFVAWLTQVVLVLVTQSEVFRSVEVEISSSTIFFLFYVAMAIALESQPHLPKEKIGRRLRLFDWLGVCTFFLGLLLYFVILPRLFESESYSRSSWVFFVAIDLYMVIRLAGFVRNVGDRRWQFIYALLLAAVLFWFCSDALGLAITLGVFANAHYDFFDPFLISGLLIVPVAARARELDWGLVDTKAVAQSKSASHFSGLGPLVFFAVMFPLMHFAIAGTQLFDPLLASIRETLVLIFLILLSLLAYAYQRLLQRENWRLEHKRFETAKALDQSEAKFRRAFESVTVGSIVIDNRGIIESFNPMARKIFGYTVEEVIGKNVQMLMPEPFAIEHDSFMERYEKSGESVIIGTAREVTGLRKNGEEFPMHLGIGERVDEGGNSYIGSITDLTELKNIEQQLMRTQKMDAVGQLTGGIAHDFNNILNIILGNLDLLKMQLGANDKAAEFLGAIQKSAQRAAELTQSYLSSRATGPRRPRLQTSISWLPTCRV